MADVIYRGSPPVGAAETQALLTGEFGAVWSPPMYRHAMVSPGDRLWVIWQADGQTAYLLGRGRVLFTEDGAAEWTNRTAPGIVKAAQDQGYGGPTNMAFLRLDDIRVAADRPAVLGLEGVPVGLTVAASRNVALLEALLSEGGSGPTMQRTRQRTKHGQDGASPLISVVYGQAWRRG